MAIIGYSPWQDAARYGQGLGDTLTQALLQMPQQRAMAAMQQQRFPLQQQLLEAQIGNLKARPEMNQEMMNYRMEMLKNQEDRTRQQGEYQNDRNDIQRQMMELREQNRSLQERLKGAPTTSQSVTEGKGAIADFTKNLAGEKGIDPTKTPITATPQLSQFALNAGQQAGSTNGIPYTAVLDALAKIHPTLIPNVATNMQQQITPGGMLPKFLGGSGPVTNQIPQVSTNSWQLSMPPAQQNGGDQNAIIQQAQEAIQKGANPMAVKQRLQQQYNITLP